MPDKHNLEKHNIVLIGPKGAGKTQIFDRLTDPEKQFEKDPKPRVGFIPKKVIYRKKNLQIEYSDCGPDIESAQINSALLRASKICLVFDATDEDWKNALDVYLDSKGINLPYSPYSVKLLLLGNKTDKLSPEQLTAVRSDATRYASDKNGTFVEYSARKNTKLGELIYHLTTGLPGTLSSSVMGPSRRAPFQQSSVASSATHLNLLKKIMEGTVRVDDLGVSSDDEDDSQNQRVVETAQRLNLTPEDTNFSFALRLAGMALIVTAITSLIYLVIVAAGFVSTVALTGVVNQVVVTVGGLLGMSAPAAALTQFFATYGISAVAGSELLAAGASLVTLGVGYGLRRLGQKPAAANDEDGEAVVASRSTLSTALRYVGMALMVAALVNAIYLLLIAMNVFSAVALTAGMNHLLVTVGGLLGFAAPVTAFGNACAAIGLSTTAVTSALSATGSLLMAGIGYSMF